MKKKRSAKALPEEDVAEAPTDESAAALNTSDVKSEEDSGQSGSEMESYESGSSSDDEAPATKRAKPDSNGLAIANGHAPSGVAELLSEVNAARRAKKERQKARRAEAAEMALAKDRLSRVRPDPASDRSGERFLLRVATRGVVQLFNAVGGRQAELGREAAAAGPWERKKDRARAKVAQDKAGFMAKLKGDHNAKGAAKEEEPKEEKIDWDGDSD